MGFRFADWVGCFRLEVSEELLAFVERTFVAAAPVSERARVRVEALAEASAADLEIGADGVVVSRAGSEEFYRVRLGLPEARELVAELSFEKAPGVVVQLRLLDTERLVAVQPGKPDMTFVRVR